MDEYKDRVSGLLYYECKKNACFIDQQGKQFTPYLSRIVKTGRKLQDLMGFEGFQFSRFEYPQTRTVYKDEKGDIIETRTHGCFAGAWVYFTERVKSIVISNNNKIATNTKKDILYYVRECKRAGIFSKNFLLKDFTKEVPEVEIFFKDIKNGLHLYNIVCNFRNMATKPMFIKNAIRLHTRYDIPWTDCIVLSNYLSSNDDYYSLFNMGLKINQLVTPLNEVRIPTDLFNIYKVLCESPEEFGIDPIKNTGNNRQFYTPSYVDFKSSLYANSNGQKYCIDFNKTETIGKILTSRKRTA